MARPTSFVNFNKLVLQAHKTKKNIKENKKKAYEDWQRKLGKKAQKLDRLDTTLRDTLKEIESAIKERSDDVKMQSRFMSIIVKAQKELKYYKSVPIKESLPPVPVNTTNLQATALVLMAMILYITALKAYMALAKALQDKKN